MNAFMRSLALVALVALVGCATAQNEAVVAQPASTPFDANPMARAAYLDAYRDGYRAAISGGVTATDTIRGPHRFAQEVGWRAGVQEGLRASGKPAPAQ
jgi:hypothetical protein